MRAVMRTLVILIAAALIGAVAYSGNRDVTPGQQRDAECAGPPTGVVERLFVC